MLDKHVVRIQAKQFGGYLAILREHKGLTRSGLEREFALNGFYVSEDVIYDVESGRSTLQLPDMAAWLEIFGVAVLEAIRRVYGNTPRRA